MTTRQLASLVVLLALLILAGCSSAPDAADSPPNPSNPAPIESQYASADDPVAEETAAASTQAEDVVDDEPEAESPSQSDERFGLTLTERKTIAWELCEIEDEAMVEAERLYPTNLMEGGSMENVEPNMDYWSEYEETHKAALRDEWGITYDEMISIIVEAVENDWPLPETPEF